MLTCKLIAGGRIFTIFFVLLGIAFIFAIINDFATSFIRSVEAKALEKLDDDPTDEKVMFAYFCPDAASGSPRLENRDIHWNYSSCCIFRFDLLYD